MARRKKQPWTPGDCFCLPLADGTWGYGQVVSYEPQAMNSAVCAFFAIRRNEPALAEPSEGELIAVQFVTRDLLDSGDWVVVGSKPVLEVSRYLDLAGLRNAGFIGVSIRGSGIIGNFMNAFHRLAPWNEFHDPNYLDGLLISLDRKPKDVLLAAKHS